MKKIVLIFTLTAVLSFQSKATVGYGATWVLKHSYGPSCLGNEYVEVGFFTNFETTNSQFQIQRSTDPNFSWAITGTAGFNGNFSGCGTCGSGQYTVYDYGPFAPNEVWYYRVKATSNFLNISYKDLGTYTSGIPTTVNWISQVTSQVVTGSSPATESSYQWAAESRDIQGVTISLMPTEISKIYLEQNNHKLNFSVQANTPFVNLDVSINNGGYFNVYSGSATTSHIWNNAAGYLTNIGNYNLKVRFTGINSTVYYREYDVYVVPKSDGFYVDNYCNTMRVWKGSDPSGGTPLVFSEGFDAYNTKSEQYYRKAGNDLINCLMSKGFDIYVVNYNLNAQSIKNNGAIFQSAIRYVSSINSNKQVIATGMSMGGVINRYACAKAENDGNPLPIKKFLTLDAPHQGAVIAADFQDWRKNLLDESSQNGYPDAFAEFASNNDAAKELLNYNSYDPSGNIHNSFFSYLNGLNTDGYPHLVPKIGVSFSTSSPNPNSGQWIYVHLTGAPNFGGAKNYNGYLTSAELVAGSYLPQINVDGFPATSPKYLISTALAVLRPITNPWVTITELKDPAFIPYNSSLDIINGTSKFDKVITPAVTGYHDVMPSDIIAPLVNAILDDYVFIQNKNYNNDTRTVIANKIIYAGNNVTSSQSIGDVNITGNSNIVFKAGNEIQLKAGFNVDVNSNFSAVIEQIQCDGSVEYQNQRIGSSSVDKSNSESVAYNPPTDPTYQIVYDAEKINAGSTAIADIEVDVFPNPSSGIINVKNYKQRDLFFKIYTIQEIKLEEGTVPSNNEINISRLNSGIYLLEIIDGTRVIKTFKIIKL